ncbi:MAG TPA: right-handed parallel beta-helix repeat-containing protein, partial [Gemmataceae bacterium]|nr:right-handed parallel beta-helix repeat-containing protein [Gemmataceae bacterium]
MNDLTGLQGDFDLTDGVADAGGGVVTLNAALQQARYNVEHGSGPETLSFAASGTLSQPISADFALTVNGGSGQPFLGAIALSAGGTVQNIVNATGAITVTGGVTTNVASQIRFVSAGASLAVGAIAPTVSGVLFTALGSLAVSGIGGSVTAVSGPVDVTVSGFGAVVDGISARGIRITGDENTVRDSTFVGGTPSENAHRVGSLGTVGIWIDGGNWNAVLDNTVRDVPGYGIAVDQTPTGRAEGNTVSGNTVSNTTIGSSGQSNAFGGVGVRALGGLNTRFLDNVVTGSEAHGIDASNSLGVTISGNHVVGLGSSSAFGWAHGIRVEGGSNDTKNHVLVTGNTVEDSPSTGIDIQNARTLDATGNAVTGGGGIGILVGATSSAAELYTVSDNTGQAVAVTMTHGHSRLSATGNEVERLTADGVGAYSVAVDTNTVGQSGGKGDVAVAVGFVSQSLSVSNNTARSMSVVANTPGDHRGAINSNLVNAAGLSTTAGLVVTGNYRDIDGNTVGGASAGGLVYTGSAGRLLNNRVGAVGGSSGSGNAGTGLSVVGNSNTLTGNRVEGNTGVGLRLDGNNNTVGTPSQGDANTIRANGSALGVRGHGIWATGTGNTFRTNSIAANGGRGIALGAPDRLLINDSGSYGSDGEYVAADGDTGANGLQNHPVYSHTDAQGRVFWVLNSTPGRTFAVDFFANPTRTANDFGEGETFLFSVQVGSESDPEGDGRFVFQVSGLPSGGLISATATDTATGNTSELSLVDQDGDALADEWEARGIDTNLDGVPEVVLPGAVLTQRDIYVEVDSMAGFAPLTAAVPGVPGDLATGTSLDYVVKSFLAAPAALTQSPGGIRLHVQLDPTEQAVAPVDFPNGLADLDVFKAAHFGTAVEHGNAEKLFAKSLAFRYAVFGRLSGSGSGSGFAELYGNDFAVTLGAPGWRNPEYRREQLWAEDQAATFMHELGHTLGLRHGGGGTDPGHSLLNTDDPTRDTNYAPNYYSVMNYAWEYRYSRNRAYTQGEQDFADTWRLEFSRNTLNPLDDATLNEANAIAPPGTSFPNARPTVRLGGVIGPVVPGARTGEYGPFRGGYASTYLYPPTGDGMGTYLGPQFVRMDGPVDWNGDGDTNDTGVRRVLADKNGDDAIGGPGGFSLFSPDGNGGQTSNTYEEDPLATLRTFAPDWSFLLFNFRESPNFPAGSHVGHGDHAGDEDDALGIDELALDIIAEQGGADVGVRVETSATTVLAGQSVTYTVTVKNDGPGDAGAVEVSETIPAGFVLTASSSNAKLTGNVLSFSLPTLGAGQTAVFTFTLLAQSAGTATHTLNVFTLGDTNPANDTFATTTTVWPGGTAA